MSRLRRDFDCAWRGWGRPGSFAHLLIMSTAETSNLPPELVAMQREIEEYARGHGLDFFPTIFEYIDADQLNAVAAKEGFPVRYPHWRFGMEYERLSKG